MARTTRATMVAIALAAMAFGVAMLAHSAEQYDTDIVQVALDESDPDRTRVGDLVFMGGIDIPPMGENIGGLSGLRWDGESGRLLAVTDDARWVWLTPTELNERLVGLGEIAVGPLLGEDGQALEGKDEGDSESLVRDEEGRWGVGFERDHRILTYSPEIDRRGVRTEFVPEEHFGKLEPNAGIEAFAVGLRSQLICVERIATAGVANCLRYDYESDAYSDFPVYPPKSIADRGAAPTDADALADGTYVILFRSYSPIDGNTAAIVAYGHDGTRRELATFRPPLTVDNFEGLAVRQEGERTFLYIVSDDNFSSSQRTLLMKFEVLPEGD